MILRKTILCILPMTYTKSVFFTVAKMHILQYEDFFKQIQKANAPQQAIAIYNFYLQKGGEHQKYLGTTFRILTRLLRQSQDYQIQEIKTFLKQKLKQINQIDLKQMEIQDLKNILLFFYNYSSTKSLLNQEQKEMISKLVAYFFNFYKNVKIEDQIDYFPIFISCMKLVNLYCNQLSKQFYETVLAILIDHKQILICDNMTFMNILNVIQQTYEQSNPHQHQFISSFVKIIISSNPVGIFQESGLATIMTTMYVIKDKNTILAQQMTQFNQLLNIVEQQLLTKLFTINQRILETLIADLLKYNKSSKIIRKYFEIITLSINDKGETSINPLINIYIVPHLKKQDVSLMNRCNQRWQDNLILFLNRYFNKENKFQNKIEDQIRQMISSRLLKWSNTQKLYQFYSNQYVYFKQQQGLYLFIKFIQNAYTSALMFDDKHSVNFMDQIHLYLQKLQSIWKEKRQKRMDSLIFWQPMSLFIKKIKPSTKTFLNLNHQEKQHLLSKDYLDKLAKLTKSKFINQLTYRIMIMQIKLLYANGLSKQISSFFTSIDTYAANYTFKQKMIKTLLFQTKIASDHYEAVFKWLAAFYDNSYQKLQEVIYNLIYEQSLDRQYKFDYYSTSILCFFYQNYSQPNLQKLLFVSNELFTKLLLFNQNKVVDLIFKTIACNAKLIFKYRQIIYQLINRSFKYHIDCSFSKPHSILKHIFSIPHLMDPNFVKTMIHFCMNNHIFNEKSLSDSLDKNINKYNEQGDHQRIEPLKSIQAKFKQQLKKEDQIIYDILNSQSLKGINSIKNSVIALAQRQEIFSSRQDKLQPYTHQVLSLHLHFIRKLEDIQFPLHSQNQFTNKIIHQLITQGLVKSETNQYTKLQIFKLMIDHGIYCEQFTHDHFGYFHSSFQIKPQQFLLLAAQYPIPKQQSLIADNLQHFTVNFNENLFSFLLIFTLIENPSEKITNFMKKMIEPERQHLPSFFIIYLEYFYPKKYQQLLLPARNKDEKSFYKLGKQSVKIQYKTIQKLFMNPRVTFYDFHNIEQTIKRDGCHKMILKKILQKIAPQKQIIFEEEIESPQKNKGAFFSNSKSINK